MTDTSKLKPGNVVHVRVTYARRANEQCFADSVGYPHLYEAIVHVEPRPLTVGDRVRLVRGSSLTGSVDAIRGDHAAVWWAGYYTDEVASGLERV